MRTVTFSVASRDDVNRRLMAAFRGEAQGEHISFESMDLLWKVLSPKRWDILKVMTGAGALSIREIARRLGRDVKAVHGDVHALLKAGVIERHDDGGVVFPYDAIHVDFMITKAA